MTSSSAKDLAGALRGATLTPTTPGYDDARQVWNGMVDRKPGLIARCAGAADVVAAVNHARENGLLVAVRGGGHSFPGHSVCDGGLMIDLQPMKSIRVDPVARRVRAEPGVLWRELDREAEAFGLAVTGGMISHTGIGGLTLGGGFGWLMRRHGLVIDNLVSADLVTADGRLLHASATENADLFWGLRGGGGNFGVVTSFEFQVHPLGPTLGGLVAYPLKEARSVLRGWRDFMATAPDELCTVGVLLTTPDGSRAVGIGLCYCGPDLAAGERLVAPLRKLGTVAMEQVGPMPYSAVQAMLDDAAVPHRRYYMRSNYMDRVSDDAIEVFAQSWAKVPSPLTHVVLVSMGGAVSRVAPEATAYFYRGAPFTMSVIGCWIERSEDEANIAWIRGLWEDLRPQLPNAVYVNELDHEPDRVRAAYGPATFQRLAALKRKYDPANFFRLNQNILPA